MNAAWDRMLQGSRRLAEGKPGYPWQDKGTHQTLLDGQNPDVAMLSCPDSRIPPEIIFDQGLGDLFTVCTAGQLIGSATATSLGYAVKRLYISLTYMLGHEHCGAVKVIEQELDNLMHAITPEAGDLLEAADAMDDLDEHIAAAESIILCQTGMPIWQTREAELDAYEDIERVHVTHIIEILVEQSLVTQQALVVDKPMIAGARYQSDSGKVEVLSL